MMRSMFAAALLCVVTGAATASQETFRERASSSVVSDDSIAADVRAEVDLGREVAARILSRYRTVKDDKLQRYVNLVGNGVAMNGPRTELRYRFEILDTDEINAYSAPGGYIFVTRGAIDLMQDESELAAVLAHEIAHVTQKHIVKQLNVHGTENSPESGLAHFFGGAGDPARVAFSQAVDKAVAILFEDGLKQEDEYEADEVGTMLLVQSGYDATALERYLKRIKTAKGDEMSVLHKTHPPLDDRIAHLDKLIETQGMANLGYPAVEARFKEYITH